MIDHPSGATRVVAEAIPLSVIIGTLAQVLPPIAALLAILWYAQLFYDRHFGKGRGDRGGGTGEGGDGR